MQITTNCFDRLTFYAMIFFLLSIPLSAQGETLRSDTIPTRTTQSLSTSTKVPKANPFEQKTQPGIQKPSPVGVTQNGYCCSAGKIISSSKQDCSRKKGSFFSDKRSAVKGCKTEIGFCCNTEGTVRKSNREICEKRRGIFFLQKSQAQKSCAAVKGFCCDNGQVTADNQGDCSRKKGSFFAQEKAAEDQCDKQNGYCCKDGETSRISKGECSRRKGQFSLSKQLAERMCQQEKGYCCSESKVFNMTRKICKQKKGDFFAEKNDAIRSCSQAASQNNKRTFTPTKAKPVVSFPVSSTASANVEKQLLDNKLPQPGTAASPAVGFPVPGSLSPGSSTNPGIAVKDGFSAEGSQGLQGKNNPFQGTEGFPDGSHQDPLGGTPFGGSPLENMPNKTDMQSSGGSENRSEDYSKTGNIGGFQTGVTYGGDESGGVAVGAKVGGYGTDSKEVGDAIDDLGNNDNLPDDDTVDFNNELHNNENPEANEALDQALANTLGSPLADDQSNSGGEGDEAVTGDTEEPKSEEEGTAETEEKSSESGTEPSPTADEEDSDDSDEDTESDNGTEPQSDDEAGSTEGYDNPDRDGYPSYTGNNPLSGTPLESAGEVSPSTGITRNDLVTDPASDSDSTGNVPESIPGSGVTRTSAATNPNPEKIESPTSVDQLNTKVIKKINTLINPPLEGVENFEQ